MTKCIWCGGSLTPPARTLCSPGCKLAKARDDNRRYKANARQRERANRPPRLPGPGKPCRRAGCANPVYASPTSSRRYCSPECQAGPARACQACGKPIPPGADNRLRYCDIACRKAAKLRQTRECVRKSYHRKKLAGASPA